MRKSFDVAVIGAGVFGAWIAYSLRRTRRSVVLIDTYGAGHTRASSGGESRVLRMGYGSEKIYTQWAMRSLYLWKQFFSEIGRSLLIKTGILWMGKTEDPLIDATTTTLKSLGIPTQILSRNDLELTYPQLGFDSIVRGVYEPDGGVLLARQAVEAVVNKAVQIGTECRLSLVRPLTEKGKIVFLSTEDGTPINAETFVVACGSWLPKMFPEQVKQRIQPTRQEVFFFGCPADDRRFTTPEMPTWIDFHDGVYGLPNLESRGCKIGLDRHGPSFDPDTDERTVCSRALDEARNTLTRRIPSLKHAPLLDARVCSYANTWNGDFLIDRHPDFNNVWLVGGGSGHGFKHGPAVGEHVTHLIEGSKPNEKRFTLAGHGTVRRRAIF